MSTEPKEDLLAYLRRARRALLSKLEGLSTYDMRRPMTPTATNLLGLVKHVACVQAGYFGATFGRPFPEPLAWDDEGSPDADMSARPDESLEDNLGLFERTSAHADETIEALALDATGHVPWWPADHETVTLHRVLVHVVCEIHRHVGHADICRELIDGTAGLAKPGDNLPERDVAAWAAYRATVEDAARQAAHR